MGNEDLETADDLRQRNRAVILPIFDSLDIINKYHEVLILALVVHLGLGGISARHGGDSIVLLSGFRSMCRFIVHAMTFSDCERCGVPGYGYES